MKVGFFRDYIYTIERNANGSTVCKSGDIKQVYYGYNDFEAGEKFKLYLGTLE